MYHIPVLKTMVLDNGLRLNYSYSLSQRIDDCMSGLYLVQTSKINIKYYCFNEEIGETNSIVTQSRYKLVKSIEDKNEEVTYKEIFDKVKEDEIDIDLDKFVSSYEDTSFDRQNITKFINGINNWLKDYKDSIEEAKVFNSDKFKHSVNDILNRLKNGDLI